MIKRFLSLIATLSLCVMLLTGCDNGERYDTLLNIRGDIRAAAEYSAMLAKRLFASDAISDTDDVFSKSLAEVSNTDPGLFKDYPVDESFLLWLVSEYGDDAARMILTSSSGESTDIWYEATGNSLHVLWTMYCESAGMSYEGIGRTTYKECKSPDELVMDFTGDLNFDDRMNCMKRYRSEGLNGCFSNDVLEEFESADILMINNECPFATGGTPIPGKAYTFRANPENIKLLNELSVDIAGIANNHMCDYGLDAVTETIETFENAGIPYVGAGRNIEEAKRPWYFIANGRKIAVVAATQIERSYSYTKEATDTSPGVLKTLHSEKFVSAIENAKAHADTVIVFVHWGTEGSSRFESDQVALARAFAEAGADAIIGGHTHCLQGISYTEDVPVIYSLGNFWFSSTPNDGVNKRDTGISQLIIDNSGNIKMRFIPCVQKDCQTYMASEEPEKSRILEYEESISTWVTIDEDGYVIRK